MSAAALAKLIDIVEKATLTTIPSNDIHLITQFYKANERFISEETENQDLAELALEYIDKMGLSVEVKDFGPKKLAIGNFMNIDLKVKEKKLYVSLDSRYAEFLNDRHDLRWQLEPSLFAIDKSEANYEPKANVNTRPRNITFIRMYSFVVRQFTSTMQRATVLIDEFKAQSMLMGTRYFHFVTLLNDLAYPINIFNRGASASYYGLIDHTLMNRYELLSGYRFNEGFYRFDKPFAVLPPTLTISVGDPMDKIKFYRHLFRGCTAVFGTYATLGMMMTITLPENHDMDVGVGDEPLFNRVRSVFIDGFTTDNPVADAELIAWINGREHTVIRSGAPPTNIIQVMLEVEGPPDEYSYIYVPETHPDVTPTVITLTPPVGTPSSFDVRINGERIIITLEMGFLDYEDER